METGWGAHLWRAAPTGSPPPAAPQALWSHLVYRHSRALLLAPSHFSRFRDNRRKLEVFSWIHRKQKKLAHPSPPLCFVCKFCTFLAKSDFCEGPHWAKKLDCNKKYEVAYSMFSCGGFCLTAIHCKPARVKSRGQAAMRPLIKTRLPVLFSVPKSKILHLNYI